MTAQTDEPTESEGLAHLRPDAPEFEPGNYAPYLRKGYFNQELGWWVPYYVGTLKSFNMRTGYGFIACAETLSIYRTDIYIHKSQVPVPWKIGAFVEFAVSQNSRGQPQATDAYWLPLTPTQEQESKEQQVKAASAVGSSAPIRKRHMGTLKSYSKMQGYGFITSEDINEQNSCDVYLDRGQLPADGSPWQFGQAVEFDVTYNHRGQPQARNVNWNPLPRMPLDATAGVPGAVSSGPAPVNLLPANLQTAGQQNLRNCSKIHNLLRSDRSAAVKLAIEMQENSDIVDYISFVLDRLGQPETASELVGNATALLLLAIAKMLRKSVADADRAAQHLAWCEAIAESLSKNTDTSNDDLRFDNVIITVQEDLQKARALAQSPNTKAFDGVFAKLGEVMKGTAAPNVVAADEQPPGVPAA